MVDYSDPAVVEQDALALEKFWHVVAGIYFWEFLTTLEYEWSVIRRRVSYRWAIWIYFTTRISTLAAVILSLIGIDDTAPYNCEIQNIFQYIFAYLTIAAASLLIVLRIIAVWNRRKIIIVIATGVWGINVIFLIQGVVRIRAGWVPAMDACEVLNMQITKLNLIVTLVTDIALFFIMLIGLLRLRHHERGAFGLGVLLWRQGLIWLLIATIAELLPVVFLYLNLNVSFNYMFQIPMLVTLSMAATRIHRGLVDYHYPNVRSRLPTEPGSIQAIELRSNNCNKAAFIPTPASRRVEVVINRTYEQDQTVRASQHDSSIDVEGQLCEKPAGCPAIEQLDDDVEHPTQFP